MKKSIFEQIDAIRDNELSDKRYALSIAIVLITAGVIEGESTFLKGKLKGSCNGALINASYAAGDLRKRIMQNFPEVWVRRSIGNDKTELRKLATHEIDNLVFED